MATPRYAPEFRVRIAGAPVPAALRASITSVSLQTGFEGVDRVELALVNEGLRWLDHPLLRVGQPLALALGWAPDAPTPMFDGEIVGHTASFPSSGTPTLSVAAQDRRHGMQEGTRVRWFNVSVPSVANVPLPDLVVLDAVALEHGLVPLVEPVAAGLAMLLAAAELAANPSLAQLHVRTELATTDYELVTQVAQENGWEVVVDYADPLGGYKLRFMSPLDHLTPDLTLAYGRSLLDFTPRLSSIGQVEAVTAYVFVSALNRHLQVTVGWDSDRAALTLDVRPATAETETDLTQKGKARKDVIDEPLTPASAPRRILSKLLPQLNSRVTGSGSTIGEPRIVPGAVLKLEGVGQQFGGLWRVTSATHTIDTGGYRTSFELRKEVWFGGAMVAA
jgi:phage protein D